MTLPEPLPNIIESAMLFVRGSAHLIGRVLSMAIWGLHCIKLRELRNCPRCRWRKACQQCITMYHVRVVLSEESGKVIGGDPKR